MRIGLVGGTGKEGTGLATRWAKAGHRVQLGSRDAERGAAKAVELNELLGTSVTGGDNDFACSGADVVVLCVPYSAHAGTITGLKGALADKIVVDITVPLKPPKVRSVHLPDGQSAALEAQAILGEAATVVAALHHVSSAHLADLDHVIDCDVLVCSNDKDKREVVIGLIGDLGMRGLDAGVLRNSIALESLTPVLIHMNQRYKSPGAGLRITAVEADPAD